MDWVQFELNLKSYILNNVAEMHKGGNAFFQQFMQLQMEKHTLCEIYICREQMEQLIHVNEELKFGCAVKAIIFGYKPPFCNLVILLVCLTLRHSLN